MPKILAKPPVEPIVTLQTKRQILMQLGIMTGLRTKTVQGVFIALQTLMQGHLQAEGSGECVLPELGIKVKRRYKAAQPQYQGRNPATGEGITIQAKPAKPVLKLVATKGLKAFVRSN